MADYVLNLAGVEANETLSHLANRYWIIIVTARLKLKICSPLRRATCLASSP